MGSEERGRSSVAFDCILCTCGLASNCNPDRPTFPPDLGIESQRICVAHRARQGDALRGSATCGLCHQTGSKRQRAKTAAEAVPTCPLAPIKVLTSVHLPSRWLESPLVGPRASSTFSPTGRGKISGFSELCKKGTHLRGSRSRRLVRRQRSPGSYFFVSPAGEPGQPWGWKEEGLRQGSEAFIIQIEVNLAPEESQAYGLFFKVCCR